MRSQVRCGLCLDATCSHRSMSCLHCRPGTSHWRCLFVVLRLTLRLLRHFVKQIYGAARLPCLDSSSLKRQFANPSRKSSVLHCLYKYTTYCPWHALRFDFHGDSSKVLTTCSKDIRVQVRTSSTSNNTVQHESYQFKSTNL